MTAVKRKRPYRKTRRDEQARQTRHQVLSTARRLFAERGYASTTIEAIAESAGVAIQTIYSAVGNKRAVLWAVLETAVAGDDEPRTILERIRDDLSDQPDPRSRLGRAVSLGRRLMERSRDIRRIMCSAADTDPEIAAALAEAERRRYRDAASIVRLVVGNEFPPDMDAKTAADLWFAFTSYEVYDLLINERRWPAGRYETWIARALEPLLA